MAVALLPFGPILSVVARPDALRGVDTNDPSPPIPTTTSINPAAGITNQHSAEQILKAILPSYSWLADLEAIKAGDTQPHEYHMGPEEFDIFLRVSGYKLEDANIEERLDEEGDGECMFCPEFRQCPITSMQNTNLALLDVSRSNFTRKSLSSLVRRTRWCHNRVYVVKHSEWNVIFYPCGSLPNFEACLPRPGEKYPTTPKPWPGQEEVVVWKYKEIWPCGKHPPFHEPGRPEKLFHFGSQYIEEDD